MPHTDMIEVYYSSIHGTGQLRRKDTILVKFGTKIVSLLSSHFNFETYDPDDKYKLTIKVQRWIVTANGLESYIYKKGEEPNEGINPRL